ncbi:MAG TPA: A24 family peptidase [Syntrophales bacterium]|nr:A24 family peptidase [Syntrophales bacterium]
MNLGFVILVLALVAASLTDVAHQKIPNVITYPLALFGLIYNIALTGMSGLLFSFSGILVGGGILLLFYALGGMGAGDVKLLAAVGSILGPLGVFHAFLYTALAGGLYALVVLYRHGALRDSLRRLTPVVDGFLQVRTMPDSFMANRAGVPRMCYALAISVGSVLAVLRPL